MSSVCLQVNFCLCLKKTVYNLPNQSFLGFTLILSFLVTVAALLINQAFVIDYAIYIIRSNFRNGNKDENGTWVYSIRLCCEEFMEAFPNFEVEYDVLYRQVHRVVKRFDETGSVSHGKSPGRPKIINEEVVEDVRNCLEESPRKPLRQLSQQTGLSYGTCRTVVMKELHFRPYKISVVQELLPPDLDKRIQYCNWFNDTIRNDNVLVLHFDLT